MNTRPEGALTPEELEALLDKHGRVKVYLVHPQNVWQYFVKDMGVGPVRCPRYYAISEEGERYALDWNGVCYGMKHWLDHYVFTNYWLYYAYMLRKGEKGKHEQLLP